MDNTQLITKITSLKNKIKESEEHQIRLATKQEALMEQLLEQGIQSIDEADKKIEELKHLIEKTQKEYREKYEAIEEKYAL